MPLLCCARASLSQSRCGRQLQPAVLPLLACTEAASTSRRRLASTAAPADWLPGISAGAVAGLIGRHQYQPRHEAVYEWCKKQKELSGRVRAIENELGRRSRHFFAQRAKEQHRHLQEMAVETAKHFVESESLHESASYVEVVKDAAVERLVESEGYEPQLAIQVVSTVIREVAMSHGGKHEKRSIASFEQQETKRTGAVVEVEEKNTKNFKRPFPAFLLSGKPDGLIFGPPMQQMVVAHHTPADGPGSASPSSASASARRRKASPPAPVRPVKSVVEFKTRTSLVSAEAPAYDIIQLRCYLELVDCGTGRLVETSRAGEQEDRVTIISRDQVVWDEIEALLGAAAADLYRFTVEDAYAREIVEASTFKLPALMTDRKVYGGWHGARPAASAASASPASPDSTTTLVSSPATVVPPTGSTAATATAPVRRGRQPSQASVPPPQAAATATAGSAAGTTAVAAAPSPPQAVAATPPPPAAPVLESFDNTAFGDQGWQ